MGSIMQPPKVSLNQRARAGIGRLGQGPRTAQIGLPLQLDDPLGGAARSLERCRMLGDLARYFDCGFQRPDKTRLIARSRGLNDSRKGLRIFLH